MIELDPPVCDRLTGDLVKLQLSGKTCLVVTPTPLPRFPGKRLYHGILDICYAFALFSDEDYLLPQFVMDDFQRQYHGVEAIRFMMSKGDSYPRADVIGRSVNTGARMDCYMKEVDLTHPLRAVAIANQEEQICFGPVDMVAWLDDSLRHMPYKIEASEGTLNLLARAAHCVRLHPGKIMSLEAIVEHSE